jgi:hypothetical protein
MTVYLEHANPILAVKSEVYFGFQMRCMKEIQNVQHILSKYRPPNYGMATALLMHMLLSGHVRLKVKSDLTVNCTGAVYV